MKLKAIIAALIVATASGCAQPGQPPTLGNFVVGLGVIEANRVLINRANDRISAAYKAGKIDTTTYNLLYAEESAAMDAFNGLGTSIMQNKPVTQDQVDASVRTFVTPLLANVDKYLGPATLPPPLTQP